MFILEVTLPSGPVQAQALPQQIDDDDEQNKDELDEAFKKRGQKIRSLLQQKKIEPQKTELDKEVEMAFKQRYGTSPSGDLFTPPGSSPSIPSRSESNALNCGRIVRKSGTLISDSFWIYRVGRYVFSSPTSTHGILDSARMPAWLTNFFSSRRVGKWLSTTFNSTYTWLASTRMPRLFSGAGSWLAGTRVGTWLAALRTGAGLGGRAIPIIGGILAALDVGLDYTSAIGNNKASDVISNRLANSNLNQKQIEIAMNIANKGLDSGVNETALRRYLKDSGLDELEIDSTVKEVKKAGAERNEAFKEANWNLALTGSGAAIGAVIGGLAGCGIFSVPGAIVGACIGAAVGNGINMIRKTGVFGAVGRFFEGFLS